MLHCVLFSPFFSNVSDVQAEMRLSMSYCVWTGTCCAVLFSPSFSYVSDGNETQYKLLCVDRHMLFCFIFSLLFIC